MSGIIIIEKMHKLAILYMYYKLKNKIPKRSISSRQQRADHSSCIKES